jgi:GntR family transcriptional regulator
VLPEGGSFAGWGVAGRMAESGVTVTHAIEQPEPRHATAEEIAPLGLARSAPVTRIQRTYYGEDGRAVETADIVVPASLCESVYEVPISGGEEVFHPSSRRTSCSSSKGRCRGGAPS